MGRPDALLYSLAFYSYLIGFLLYILHTALKRKRFGQAGTLLMAAGLVPHTGAFFVRWSSQNHFPLASMYEYMGLMAWMVVAALLYFRVRYRNDRLGVFIAPVAVMLLVVASLLPSDVNRQLMPALQSVWLIIHVTLAALGSGAFLVAFAAASLYLLLEEGSTPSLIPIGNRRGREDKDTPPLSPPQAGGESGRSRRRGNDTGKFPWGDYLAFWVAVPVITALVTRITGMLPTPITDHSAHNLGGSAVTGFAFGTGAGAMYWGRGAIGLGLGLVVAAVVWPLVQRSRSKPAISNQQSAISNPPGAKMFIVLVFGVLLSAVVTGFLVKANWVKLTDRSYFKIFEFFGAMLVISWLLTPPLYALLIRPGGGLFWAGKMGVSPAVVEELSYSAVAIGYPLYTVGALFAGAIWAEQAWGTWWGWDPKEVGALIIWLFYTGFLHARYQRNWKGVPAAVLVVLGMVMVFLSFFGNYFFGGLHSFEVT